MVLFQKGGVDMRKITALLALALVLALFVLPTAAVTGASKIESQTIVSPDGSCQVSLNITLHLESGAGTIEFPVPGNARNVTVNGSSPRSHRSGGVLLLDLTRMVGGLTGDFSLMIHYTLPQVVAPDDTGKLMLNLPLLSGFAHPVESFSFSITFPGDITNHPAFSSVYFQNSIESDLSYMAKGDLISGKTTKSLKDQEALAMTLEVSPDMFPQDPTQELGVALEKIAMGICAGLAALYWLLFLRCLPPRALRRTTPPEGLSAGELRCVLTGQGPDLTLMVMTWAQLGYILIHLDDSDRVILHKRMEMGNERSALEVRCFHALFGKSQAVNGTGPAYALLCRKVAAMRPDAREWFQPKTGNPRILRVLSAGIGLCGGVSLGLAMTKGSALAGLVVVLLALVGAFSSWLIQGGCYAFFCQDRQSLWVALALGAVWLIVGGLSGDFAVALLTVLSQLLFGSAAAYSGRRSDLGRQLMGQILGFRRYLCTAGRGELQRICREDPEYFFDLTPYALALGAEQTFAKRFGAIHIPGCPYLTTGMDGHMTALEWAGLMVQATIALDERQKQLPYEQLLAAAPTPAAVPAASIPETVPENARCPGKGREEESKTQVPARPAGGLFP